MEPAPAPPLWRRARAAAFRFATRLVQRLPEALALALGRAAGELVALTQGRYLARVIAHHQAIFGRPPSSPRRFLRAYYRHLGLLGIELLRLPLLADPARRRRLDLRELRAVTDLAARGPLIVTAGHVGHWEMAGWLLACLGVPLQAVARPLDDPALEDWLRRLRESSGMRVFPKWNVLWALKKALDRGGVIGINADQHARENALVVPFGKRPAATSATLAQLHLMSGATVVVGSVVRLSERGGWRFEVWDTIPREGTDVGPESQARVLERVNRALVEGIRRHPAQWLWTHRRWRG